MRKEIFINMNDTELIKEAYKIIGGLTPLKSDCGRLCGAVCCEGDDDVGMALFPGEKELYEGNDNFEVTRTDYGMELLLCKGRCNREERPLSCRIFPLAIVNKNGSMKVIADPRSRAMCPLYKNAVNGRLDAEFVRAVKQVGRLLFQSESMRAFARETLSLCEEFVGL